jgi:flagella basal body P-ring formation protein FlgA
MTCLKQLIILFDKRIIMNNRVLSFMVICCVVMLSQSSLAADNSYIGDPNTDSVLHIHLPRQVTITNNTLELGQISVIRGEESLVARARRTALGRFSVPGQKIVVDRQMVLSRLACRGILNRTAHGAVSDVIFTGAQEVTVQRHQRVIKASEFIELATSYLKENPPVRSVLRFKPVRRPKDMVLPWPSKELELVPRLVENGAMNQVKVQITIFADSKKIGVREMTFRLEYESRKVVTKTEIPPGGLITPDNVEIEKDVSNYPVFSDFKSPYGLVAKHRLQPDTVVRPDMIGPVKPAVAVRRNETVLIRIESPGFLVTAVGKAMQEAKVGEYVRVRNLDSQRVILCRVSEDGTVEPIL